MPLKTSNLVWWKNHPIDYVKRELDGHKVTIHNITFTNKKEKLSNDYKIN